MAYLPEIDSSGHYHIRFLMRKASVTPKPDHNIQCLEFCAAVLIVEMAELISEELDLDVQVVKFYTDSKIILGYINKHLPTVLQTE